MYWAGDGGGLPTPFIQIEARYNGEFQSWLLNQLDLDSETIIFSNFYLFIFLILSKGTMNTLGDECSGLFHFSN